MSSSAVLAEEAKFYSFASTGVEYTGYFIASTYISVLTHELGHAAAAKAYGAKNIRIEAGLGGGVTRWNRARHWSDSDRTVVGLAGNAVNRLNVGWSNLLLPRLTDGEWPSKFTATFYLMNRYFLVWEWVRAAWDEDADFYKASDSMSSSTISHDQVFGFFGAVIAADIWWSWRTIQNNGRRFAGRAAKGDSTSSDFFVVPVNGGAQVAYRTGF